ncbi:hypothetical protein DSO57_1037056 [Entomophthora muscae]|uniref:Uncharacterized protein n=1 Tax=Entomophthora muscae TaxID=34485 RepID=A0ACC2TX93_9FUNG|nr:hypothetical protein DSO57_1037056 [Entomophthora muscae]
MSETGHEALYLPSNSSSKKYLQESRKIQKNPGKVLMQNCPTFGSSQVDSQDTRTMVDESSGYWTLCHELQYYTLGFPLLNECVEALMHYPKRLCCVQNVLVSNIIIVF